LNIIGFIHYLLPGVFLSNPFAGQVNGSLWTVPFEIGCYGIMTALIASGAIKSRPKIIALFAAFTAFYCLALSYGPDLSRYDSPVAHYLVNFAGERGRGLYFYFFGGTLLYIFRERIPYSPFLFALSTVLSLLHGLLPDSMGGPHISILFMFPVSYATAYIGLQPIRRLPLYSRGDYSYGLYLYAYPLQQMLVALHPSRFSIAFHSLCSIVLATIVAIVSWHCVEQPTLRLRRKFSFTARKGEASPTLPAVSSSDTAATATPKPGTAQSATAPSGSSD
jgi:peptidoglycan/LPS O-acetylase OafA/YrhL